jgi:hypothetical protein
MGKRICYIHAGPHKSGTTAIQCFLQENRPELLKHGYFVPESGAVHGGHHALARKLCGQAVPDHQQSVDAAFVQMLYATAFRGAVEKRSFCQRILQPDQRAQPGTEADPFPAQPVAITKFALCASGSGLPPIGIIRSFRQGRDSSPHFQIRAVDRVRRWLRCGTNCPPIYERNRCPWCRTRVSPNRRAGPVAVREHSNQP